MISFETFEPLDFSSDLGLKTEGLMAECFLASNMGVEEEVA